MVPFVQAADICAQGFHIHVEAIRAGRTEDKIRHCALRSGSARSSPSFHSPLSPVSVLSAASVLTSTLLRALRRGRGGEGRLGCSHGTSTSELRPKNTLLWIASHRVKKNKKNNNNSICDSRPLQWNSSSAADICSLAVRGLLKMHASIFLVAWMHLLS